MSAVYRAREVYIEELAEVCMKAIKDATGEYSDKLRESIQEAISKHVRID